MLNDYYRRQRATSMTWTSGDIDYPVTPSQHDALIGLAAVFKRVPGYYASQMFNGIVIIGCHPDGDKGISVEVDRRGRVMHNKTTR